VEVLLLLARVFLLFAVLLLVLVVVLLLILVLLLVVMPTLRLLLLLLIALVLPSSSFVRRGYPSRTNRKTMTITITRRTRTRRRTRRRRTAGWGGLACVVVSRQYCGCGVGWIENHSLREHEVQSSGWSTPPTTSGCTGCRGGGDGLPCGRRGIGGGAS
jgi:hypothetical protein